MLIIRLMLIAMIMEILKMRLMLVGFLTIIKRALHIQGVLANDLNRYKVLQGRPDGNINWHVLKAHKAQSGPRQRMGLII